MSAPAFVVGRKPGGISAVCLRRGGKLVTVPVAEMLEDRTRKWWWRTTIPASAATPGVVRRAAAVATKKKPKRKGAKRR